MIEKLKQIKIDGLSNLQIVLDFDRTITGPINNKPAEPMISFLRNSNILGEEYKKLAQANFEHYYKFEKSHDLNHIEKSILMQEWWEKHLTQLVEFKLTKEKIQNIANSEKLILRDGVKEFFDFSKNNNILIIIFSAGILGSESIKTFLERWGINTESIKIIINELVFNDNGEVINFEQPIITSENKDESLFEEERIEKRKNSIVVGDGISDARMVLDKENSTVYRVGILDRMKDLSEEEFKIEKNIYLNHFDEVTDNFYGILDKLK